jgi:phage terminase large subunit-like protein
LSSRPRSPFLIAADLLDPPRTGVSWAEVARDEQRPPGGDWFVWLILAGRGWGKTRTGAEWAAARAREFPGCRIALVAQAFGDGRDTMVEGESGLLGVLEPRELRGGDQERAWNRSLGELFLANGSRFKIFSSEKPRQLRGPQHHFAWCDEPFTWYDAHKGPDQDTTWSNLLLTLRLSIGGSEPRVVVTGTPRPVRLLTQRDREPVGLLHRASTVIVRGHTDENLANLAPSFRAEVIDPVRGTRLGRQELAAEVLEDVPGALWKRAWIDERRRVTQRPAFWRRKVMGLDPADGVESGDEQAFTIAGQGADWGYYVLRSEGTRTSPRPLTA